MLNFFLCFLVSILPLSYLRIFFYNKLLGYNIDNDSEVKFLTVIISKNCEIVNTKFDGFIILNVKNVKIISSKICKYNIIKNFYSIQINENVYLGKFNKIIGEKKIRNDKTLLIKKNVNIENQNYLDLSDNINIEENVKIFSFCQLWTHGFSAERELKTGMINIKKNCTINTGCLISQGVDIGENSILSHGVIVAKNLESDKFYYHELTKKNENE